MFITALFDSFKLEAFSVLLQRFYNCFWPSHIQLRSAPAIARLLDLNRRRVLIPRNVILDCNRSNVIEHRVQLVHNTMYIVSLNGIQNIKVIFGTQVTYCPKASFQKSIFGYRTKYTQKAFSKATFLLLCTFHCEFRSFLK